MKDLKKQFKSIAKALQNLSDQFDEVSAVVEGKGTPKKKAAKKVVTKKAAKKVVKKKVAKKVTKKAAKKVTKKAAKKVTKKAAKKVTKKVTKKATSSNPPVLETILDIIEKGRKGTSIAKLKEKTDFGPRQISNALYKLTKKNLITQKIRGVYIKKKK